MVRAKKTLSQNFLNSKGVARDIVQAGELTSQDVVLEIGPGKGLLTAELLASGAHVIAVEKDDRLIPILAEKFAFEISKRRLTLIHGDIIELVEKQTLLLPLSYKLIANIPYQITGQILRIFLESSNKPERMILMVQKEVATRIVARDKKESILSLSVKAYGTPRIVKKVPARYFSPAPNVDSAVIAIEHISSNSFKTTEHEQAFFDLVKTGFAHKRKQLAGNLKELLKDQTIPILASVNIAPTARAEDITLGQWLALAQVFEK
ncbi:MAG: 16S rRNA (adenine(1518)-N(6)/adenine(1519)-N(6))-dimethyltransferase RsmA [Patescibacteria group bacterium]